MTWEKACTNNIQILERIQNNGKSSIKKNTVFQPVLLEEKKIIPITN